MSALQICQCIVLLAGAFALLSFGVGVKLVSTIERLNMTIDRSNQTIDKANIMIDDINYKLDMINRPFEAISSFLSPFGKTRRKRK